MDPNGVTEDYAARGNYGQMIYVSPSDKVVIVRNGVEYGIGSRDWIGIFANAAERLGKPGTDERPLGGHASSLGVGKRISMRGMMMRIICISRRT